MDTQQIDPVAVRAQHVSYFVRGCIFKPVGAAQRHDIRTIDLAEYQVAAVPPT